MPWEDWFSNAATFIETSLCAERTQRGPYIPGSQAIAFYEHYLAETHRVIVETSEARPRDDARRRDRTSHEHEEALLARLGRERPFGMLFLIGGLGAGKSTTMRFIVERIVQTRTTHQAACPRVCAGCERGPILIDCIKHARPTPLPVLVKDVFRDLRLAIYERLLDSWVLRNSIDRARLLMADPKYRVLRRVLIANDVAQVAQTPLEPLLPTRGLAIGGPLLATNLTTDEAIELAKDRRAASEALEVAIETMAADEDLSIAFLADVLRLYVTPCSIFNPLNLIIIDNLDQLPTKVIDALVQRLHSVASQAEGVPFLIPLRPSSITAEGIVRNLACRLHYGPNNFELVLQRLEGLLLSRSREEIRADARVFHRVPGDDELTVLLGVAYLYALISARGASTAEPAADPRQVRLHESHSALRRLELRSETLTALATTVSALVGTCSRYALDEMKRYFENVYRYPVVAAELRAQLSTTGRRLRIPYGSMTYVLIAHGRGATGRAPRLANLLMPVIEGRNRSWPSLAKLRILDYLYARPRAFVGDIVLELSRYAIPMEIAIDALNDLHDKYRLLIWFSDNDRIDGREDFGQYAVISEHGLAYFREVLGDFEYLWYSATDLDGLELGPEPIGFPTKLDSYLRLLGRVGDIEWKQICFFRSSGGGGDESDARPATRPMVGLAIAYASLARGLGSIEMALTRGAGSSEFRSEVDRAARRTAEVVGVLESRYRLAFGGPGYRDRYSAQIESAWRAVDGLLGARVLSEETARALGYLVEGWKRGSADQPSEWTAQFDALLSATPLPAYQGSLADASAPPEASEAIQRARVETASVERSRRALGNWLRIHIPSATELRNRVGWYLDDIEMAIERLWKLPGGQPESRVVLDQQRDRVRGLLARLDEYRFHVKSPVAIAEMDDLKRRANGYLEVVESLARLCGVEPQEHLRHRWQ